jgi:hypothetical protein
VTSESKVVNVRVPEDLLRRVDALQSKIGHLPEVALLGTMDRSKVLRVALLRGVAALEAEVAKTAPPRKSR